jgi:hypothetical protein
LTVYGPLAGATYSIRGEKEKRRNSPAKLNNESVFVKNSLFDAPKDLFGNGVTHMVFWRPPSQSQKKRDLATKEAERYKKVVILDHECGK